jgi:hypothetical protein
LLGLFDTIERSELLDRIGRDAIFLEVDDAVQYYRARSAEGP